MRSLMLNLRLLSTVDKQEPQAEKTLVSFSDLAFEYFRRQIIIIHQTKVTEEQSALHVKITGYNLV